MLIEVNGEIKREKLILIRFEEGLSKVRFTIKKLKNYTIYSCGLITHLAELQVGKYINWIYNDEIKKKKLQIILGPYMSI